MMPKPGENLNEIPNAWSSARNWALRRHAAGGGGRGRFVAPRFLL